MHWALCMGVLAWHSWQFSAVSRKCYLILHVHDRSESSWWPWVVLSALCLQLHSSLLAETKAQSWGCLKCVGHLHLDWWFWCLIYFAAACQCPDNALAATHTPAFCAGSVCMASKLSKAEAHPCAPTCALHSKYVSSVILGTETTPSLPRSPQVLASSPVGILVKTLCFQGRWLVNPPNIQTARRSLSAGRTRFHRASTVITYTSFLAMPPWHWITPWAGVGWFQISSTLTPPLLLCLQTHWQALEPTRTQDHVKHCWATNLPALMTSFGPASFLTKEHCHTNRRLPSVTIEFWHYVIPSRHYFFPKIDVKKQKSKISPTFKRKLLIQASYTYLQYQTEFLSCTDRFPRWLPSCFIHVPQLAVNNDLQLPQNSTHSVT